VMKLPRRRFLHLAAGAAALPALPRIAWGQTYPSRPVRIVVGFAAGGPTDLFARVLGDLLSARWGGRTLVVENRPGAGTILATATVAKAAPDGYTLLMANTSFFINPAIGQKLPYDPLKDFAPIGMFAVTPTVLSANKSFPASTIPELIEVARKSAPPLNFASPGPRGAAHFAGEMLKLHAGIKMQHINYNGSAPALTDVIGGRVPLMFDPWLSTKPHVEAGSLKIIAVASEKRLRDAPHVPTITETYPGYGVNSVNFIVAPAGIPEMVQQKLSEDLRAVVETAEFAAKMIPLGADPKTASAQELAVLIPAEIDRWTALAKAAEIKLD
jgi:tripartite-type tricarboxylate transporter receptor subunit TctC